MDINDIQELYFITDIANVPSIMREKEFDKADKYIIACRVQDNLGGKAIKTKEETIAEYRNLCLNYYVS